MSSAAMMHEHLFIFFIDCTVHRLPQINTNLTSHVESLEEGVAGLKVEVKDLRQMVTTLPEWIERQVEKIVERVLEIKLSGLLEGKH
jgi:uncharacterized protein YoxC